MPKAAVEAGPGGTETTKPAEPTFDIWEYAVRGNSVLTSDQIERAVYPYLGSAKRFSDIDAARKALEQVYRKAGYATARVEIPEQPVTGTVELLVIEGGVRRARVTGTSYYDADRILSQVPALGAGAVPNYTQAQDQLTGINRYPGRQVVPLLSMGDEPGTTDVELKVKEDRPYTGALEVNNHHGPSTSSTRINASARYANLWQAHHAIGLQYQTAPEKPKEVQAWVLNYDMPSSTSQNRYSFYAVRSKSNVATLGGTNILGNSRSLGLRWNAPLPEAGKYSHSFTAGADYKSTYESANDNRIVYLPFTLSYEAYRPGGKGLWRFGTGFNFAIRGLASNEERFQKARSGARSNYVAWKWDVQRTQELPRGFSAFAWIEGQVSDQPLVSNEQFSAGGAQSVRGYLESEVLGDSGAHATVELRTPAKSGDWPFAQSALTGFVFVDWASAWVNSAPASQTSVFRMASAGLGLRITAGHWKLNLDGAWPFKTTTNTRKGDPRIEFEVRYDFY